MVLTANFANEYFALDGETPVTDLPSVNSMQRRVGQAEEIKERYADQVKLLPFLGGEFKRIGEMILPYSIVNFIEGIGGSSAEAGLRINLLLGAVGLGAFLVCLIGLCFIPHSKILVASAMLAGFGWSVPMRNFAAFHEFQILFHIGLSLDAFHTGNAVHTPYSGGTLYRRSSGGRGSGVCRVCVSGGAVNIIFDYVRRT